MSITDDDLETTNSAIAKLEGIEPSGDIGEFNARKLKFGPDKAIIGPVVHLAAERIRLTALEWEHFEVRQVGATLGGIVKGLDLSKPLADVVFEELVRAWVDYKVLFFRNQVLSAEQHIEFASRFGELEVHPFLRNSDERPELVRFAKDADTGGYENGWHHDVTWRAEPSKGAILRAIQVPETGGDTLFCDMNAAYEGLSDEVKDRIEGLVAEHDYMQAFGHTIAGADAAAMREKYPIVEHPVVIHHPVSGDRLLYVNRFFTTRIVGLEPEESDELLVTLFAQANTLEYHCRFHWKPNSIAMWDNFAVQHYASSDYWPDVRVMERASIIGVRPTF
ncbi:MAG TPA: TauD/TfdA family dioxygenase [Ilumatobacteraceae bacterium]|nr:TauD/TfdA family dioxygenase [Ilumatobacteraceae bacterium]